MIWPFFYNSPVPPAPPPPPWATDTSLLATHPLGYTRPLFSPATNQKNELGAILDKIVDEMEPRKPGMYKMLYMANEGACEVVITMKPVTPEEFFKTREDYANE